MSYCLNPKCLNPGDPLHDLHRVCRHCGSPLVIDGRYRARSLLGEGGFGKTFEVVDDRGKLKVLKVLIDSNPKAVALFKREAQVLAQLHHPGIPRVETDGYFLFHPRNSRSPLHCLIMENIEGWNLEDWMSHRENWPITEAQAIDWLKQLSEILHQVHQHNYFHRDIKPSNIMRRPRGQLALIDFGTVREVSQTYLAKVGGGHRVTGIISPGYTPPEQINGKAVPQSDFFALGRTFVYLLTGKHPSNFPEDSRTGQLKWRSPALPLSNELADLIDYMMSPFPGNRPHNTQAIYQRLKEIESAVLYPRAQIPLLLAGGMANSTNSPIPLPPIPLPPTGAPATPSPPTPFSPAPLPPTGAPLPPKAGSSMSPAQLAPRLRRGYKSRRSGRLTTRSKSKKIILISNLLASAIILLIPISVVLIYGKPDFGLSQLISLSTSSKAAEAEPEQKSSDRLLLPAEYSSLKKIALNQTISGHTWGVTSVAISPDGQFLVSGSFDKTVKVWELPSGALLHSLDDHSQGVGSVTISPNGHNLASGSGIGKIRLWQLSTGNLLYTLDGHSSSVLALAYSPDGRTLASSSEDGTIKLWNLETGELQYDLSGHSDRVWSVVFNPRSPLLASSSYDGTIKLWNTKTGKLLHTLHSNSRRVSSVAISPNGKILASGSSNGTIQLWQLSTGKVLRTLHRHYSAVQSIAFSPDGLILASSGGSLDPTIKLWDIDTGELLSVLHGHSDTVHSLSISSDGKVLTSGSEDNTIKVWQVP